jgi:hypothetical protein
LECDLARGDVSVVNQGANPHTEAQIRSLATGLTPYDFRKDWAELDAVRYGPRRSAT